MNAPLKILATPIGNLGDITQRARDELKHADIILAEDTRHTGQLLKALGIERKAGARLISCHAHREVERAAFVLASLANNERVVLVSDAGSPAISDPGSLLAQAVIKGGGTIEVRPGPSALTAALMGAALDTTRFAFLGFLPKKKSLRQKLVMGTATAGLALVFYEAPSRVEKLLEELYLLLGARRVVVARELTKIFETFHRGLLGAVLEPPFIAKGECVVIVEAGPVAEAKPTESQKDELSRVIEEGLSLGMSSRDLSHSLVVRFSLKKKAALNLVLQAINAKEEAD